MPLGVVAVVYEARPNVTIDAAALCLKSGNAIVLRGSSSAAHSNAVLAAVAAEAAAESAGLPEGALSLVAGGGREELAELATQTGVVDLIIPRGGEGLKAALKGVATVPVIYAASGNCHVYVDASADLEAAQAIVLNAKVQRPGVCNAAETLLVHCRRGRGLPAAGTAGADRRRRHAARRRARPRRRRGRPSRSAPASEEDWDTEYLALELAVGSRRLDRGGDRAHQPPRQRPFGGDRHPRHRVGPRVPARASTPRCVYVNASTRFTDGGEFGMGAEIGNSTQKLHARGPIGLRELCTFKYLVEGDGPRPPVSARRASLRLARVRVGILGGTFNPPHLGHLVCAQEAYLAARARRVMLMPARIPPHKPVEDEPGPEHRLELCRLAVDGDERFDGQRSRDPARRPSYTVDTLKQLRTQRSRQRAVPDRRWRRGGRAAPLARAGAGAGRWPRSAVAKRRGTPRAAVDEALAGLPGGERARVLPRCRGSSISSTEVRAPRARRRADPLPRPRRGRRLHRRDGLYGGS